MKYCSLLILLVFTNISFAQLPGYSLIDETSRWSFNGVFAYQDFAHCNQNFAYNYSTVNYYLDGDSTIAGHTYFKMYSERIDSNYCTNDPSIIWIDTVHAFKRLIREEDNKLFIYDSWNNVDALFRDYSTITVGTDLSNSCTVASIDTLYLLYQPYLKYNCDCDSEFLIQAVGTKRNLFAALDCGIGIEGDWTNSCYSKNGFTIDLNGSENCVATGDSTLYVSTQDRFESMNYKVFPNPVKDVFTVELPGFDNGQYALFSVEGKKILSGRFSNLNKLQIDVLGLNSGIYLLNLQLENEIPFSEKIIKL